MDFDAIARDAYHDGMRHANRTVTTSKIPPYGNFDFQMGYSDGWRDGYEECYRDMERDKTKAEVARNIISIVALIVVCLLLVRVMILPALGK